METGDTFQLLDISVDPATKAVNTSSSAKTLQAELATLNALHRASLGLDTPNSILPPPLPVNPKRTQQITKLRDSGNASFRKGAHADAIRMYSLAIEMALGRPNWEPQALVREEVAALYSNRAQAWMSLREWAEAAVDAEISVEMKKVQNAKAWFRRGRSLVEMGRLEEAQTWVNNALDFEPNEVELQHLKKEIQSSVEKNNKS